MSPNEDSTQRRLVILPLPIWVVLQVMLAVLWAYRVGRRAFARCESSLAGATASMPRHHQDRQCAAIAEKLFGHLNHYRQQNGLGSLRWNGRLEGSSLYQSQRMSELGEFSHELNDGVTLSDRVKRAGYKYVSCGENLFWLLDPSKDVAGLAWEMHDGWVRSPGHQANLVGDWTEVGIGVVPDGEGGYYATQNFGRPRHAILTSAPREQ